MPFFLGDLPNRNMVFLTRINLLPVLIEKLEFLSKCLDKRNHLLTCLEIGQTLIHRLRVDIIQQFSCLINNFNRIPEFPLQEYLCLVNRHIEQNQLNSLKCSVGVVVCASEVYMREAYTLGDFWYLFVEDF